MRRFAPIVIRVPAEQDRFVLELRIATLHQTRDVISSLPLALRGRDVQLRLRVA